MWGRRSAVLLFFVGVVAPPPNASDAAEKVGKTRAVGKPAICLSYEGRISLSGRLIKRTIIGPPNYESIADGDRPLDLLMLVLPEPICMVADKGRANDLEGDVSGITEVQLHATPKEISLGRLGRTIRVSGKAVEAHWGFHRAPIVLWDVRVEPSRRRHSP